MGPLNAFFVFGSIARVPRLELALPEALTDTVEILLLFAIARAARARSESPSTR